MLPDARESIGEMNRSVDSVAKDESGASIQMQGVANFKLWC